MNSQEYEWWVMQIQTMLTKAKYKRPVAIILGHEKNGVSKDVLKLCDLAVEIPMFGFANSLNVATSAGIILYEVLGKI
jgi:TrmH family RNA methyltransferase